MKMSMKMVVEERRMKLYIQWSSPLVKDLTVQTLKSTKTSTLANILKCSLKILDNMMMVRLQMVLKLRLEAKLLKPIGVNSI